jgi:hypothetical protein
MSRYGVTPGPRVTPYLLMADAYAAKRNALAKAPPDRQGAWNAATRVLVDEALTVDSSGGTHKVKNRRLHGVTSALIDFLVARLDAHNSVGDVPSWVQTNLVGDISDALDGPLFAGLVDLTARFEGDPDTLSKLYGLLQSIVDPSNDAVFTTALTATADIVQLLTDDPDLVPLAHALGPIMDPTAGALPAQLKLLKKAHDLDPNAPMAGQGTTGNAPARHATLVTVLQNLLGERPMHGPTPMSDLADAIAQVNRVDARKPGDLDAADYGHLLGEVRDFLIDEKRGFMRFVQIIKSRGPAN